MLTGASCLSGEFLQYSPPKRLLFLDFFGSGFHSLRVFLRSCFFLHDQPLPLVISLTKEQEQQLSHLLFTFSSACA